MDLAYDEIYTLFTKRKQEILLRVPFHLPNSVLEKTKRARKWLAIVTRVASIPIVTNRLAISLFLIEKMEGGRRFDKSLWDEILPRLGA